MSWFYQVKNKFKVSSREKSKIIDMARVFETEYEDSFYSQDHHLSNRWTDIPSYFNSELDSNINYDIKN